MTIIIYDTTFRDGTQGDGIEISAKGRMEIVNKLIALGFRFDYIEGGWPGANAVDDDFFHLSHRASFAGQITAFSSVCKVGIKPERDKNILALVAADTSAVCIFAKASISHVRHALRTTSKENIRMISETVRFLKKAKKTVIVDIEHFFDGFKEDRKYALRVIAAAAKVGADWIVFCDTNGKSDPWEVERIVRTARKSLISYSKVRTGIHTHNDRELAVANSIAAIRAGVEMIQGTINGYGERKGNANLITLIGILTERGILKITPKILAGLKELAEFVAAVANKSLEKTAAYVGDRVFAVKGGAHASAIRIKPELYEHARPENFGNNRHVVISDKSGASSVLLKAEELGIDLTKETAQRAAKIIKRKEHDGFRFAEADSSFLLIVLSEAGIFKSPFLFCLADYKSLAAIKHTHAKAVLSIKMNGKKKKYKGDGGGPVHACDQAMRIAWETVTDSKVPKLLDYKVKKINGRGAGAKVSVRAEYTFKNKVFTTVGVSDDIIVASCLAIVDGYSYALYLLKKI